MGLDYIQLVWIDIEWHWMIMDSVERYLLLLYQFKMVLDGVG